MNGYPLSYLRSIDQLPVFMRNYILDYIKDHHSVFNNGSDINLWTEFFVSFLKKGEQVAIYSMNYDDLIFWVVKQINSKNKWLIETGFALQAVQNVSSDFNVGKFYDADNIFVQIHGNICLGPATKAMGNATLAYYPLLAEASKKRKSFFPSLNSSPAGQRIYNQFMITGLNKFDAMANEPFATYYRKLTKDIDDAKKFFIIGYSGADAHLNCLLQSDLNSDKKFVVVDKIGDKYFGNLFENCFQDKFWQYQYFLPKNHLPNPFGKHLMLKQEIHPTKDTTYFFAGCREFLSEWGKLQ